MGRSSGGGGDLSVAEFRLGPDHFVVLSYRDSEPRFSPTLTLAERAVAAAAMAGKSNAQIAAARGVSERTVANQMAAVLKKLGMRSRIDLASRADV